MADDAAAANEKALDILNRGVDSLSFKIPGKNISKDFVETLLKGIECEAVELNFNTCKRHTLELAKILDGYFTAKGYDKTKIVGSFNWDPMEKIVVKGLDTVALLAQAPQIVEAMKEYPNFRTICVNAVALNNNGAYIVQELGYALAWGNEYMNQLVEAGTDADEAAKNIKFNLGISENFFMEMAKFRAARMLWAEMQYDDEYGFGFYQEIYAARSFGYVDTEFKTVEELNLAPVVACKESRICQRLSDAGHEGHGGRRDCHR